MSQGYIFRKGARPSHYRVYYDDWARGMRYLGTVERFGQLWAFAPPNKGHPKLRRYIQPIVCTTRRAAADELFTRDRRQRA